MCGCDTRIQNIVGVVAEQRYALRQPDACEFYVWRHVCKCARACMFASCHSHLTIIRSTQQMSRAEQRVRCVGVHNKQNPKTQDTIHRNTREIRCGKTDCGVWREGDICICAVYLPRKRDANGATCAHCVQSGNLNIMNSDNVCTFRVCTGNARV